MQKLVNYANGTKHVTAEI